MTETQLEWRLFVGGVIGVVALLALASAGWGAWRLTHEPPSAFERTERCLRHEKFLTLRPVPRDAIAQSADGGALATTVEGNNVTLVMASSEDRAARIEADYRTVGATEPGTLERRGRTVYLWELPSSPTQRQTLYDCAY